MHKRDNQFARSAAILVAALCMAVWQLHGARGNDVEKAWAEGYAACTRGDFDAAVRHFSKGIQLNPQDAAPYNNRAYAYLRKGDNDSAIADYTAALRLDAKCAMASFYRGAAYEKKGDHDKAMADYARAIRFDARFAREYCESGGSTTTVPPGQESRENEPPRAVRSHPKVELFVAPNGNDHNPGTIDRPFATLYKAHQWVRPGETINLRAGTYQALLGWGKSGTRAAPITVKAYRGEDVRLQASEQYPWSRVDDPRFGDCWKTTISNRPIRYPGPQHTIWQDAVRAESERQIQIWAIVRDGYPCAPMNAAADFAHPEQAKGLPLVNRDGRLIYDITWYDRETKALWFKPGPSRIADPSQQLYVTSSACGQFSITASHLKFDGLKFEYLLDIHQHDHPTDCDINNCQIKHALMGIVGGGERCTYTSLLVDKVGDWLTWRNGEYERGYLSHCLYMNGSRCVVSNCFFGRSNKGGAIQNYPDGTVDNLFDSNVLYHCDGGSIFMGTNRNYITNNISLQATYGFGPYADAQGFTFANNYSEADSPFSFAYQEAQGNCRGTFERFTVAGNVFNNRGGAISYRGNLVNATSSRIDGNVYLGAPRWMLGLTVANPPRSAAQECSKFASYVAALHTVPGCGAWEISSQAHRNAPRFDLAAFDALLDSNPTLDVVLLKARQYVKTVAAPFPQAGPALD